MAHDLQACRADVTALVSNPVGTYGLTGFTAKISNGSTDNASFSLVFVYSGAALTPRRVVLYDGLWTMDSSTLALSSSQRVPAWPVQIHMPSLHRSLSRLSHGDGR